jgi:DNA-binding MarR family transcriptional regulator
MLKRAHWKNVGFAKKLVEKVHGMTPARFELLYMLRRLALVMGVNEVAGVSKVQTDLWKDLGLHRSTVCRLIKRLVMMDSPPFVNTLFDEFGGPREERNIMLRAAG